MPHEANLQFYFTIPNNLPCKHNTSACGAGDSLWAGWATNFFIWNHCFDIGIMYPFAYSLPPLQVFVTIIILSMGGDCFTLYQS